MPSSETPSSETPVSVKEMKFEVKKAHVKKSAAKLPKTGEDNSNEGMAAVSALVTLGLFGVLAKRRKK